MSKRCCAQHCFNCTLYTKNISYFSFPKNKMFADQWADLAGRSDLKEKPLTRIIKYFLCSEHFTANCFHDKETRQILKRDLPHSIALPSIFKNNLHETMQISNPKQSIEVHNIVLLQNDDDESKPNNSILGYEIDSNSLSEEYSCDSEKPSRKEICKTIQDGRDVLEIECLESEEQESHQQDENGDNLNAVYLPYQCRLCFKELKNDDLITAFEDSLHLQEFISRVMSDKITVGDEFSQVVCKNCENNSLLCLIIIQQMDATQQKIASSSEHLT
ncbi:uncharacterized protein LOC129939837 isoform X1 [Eupeodes corollae]|uniref:uncharacterized protein LOC129939837 isoform X1 n=2 Tax=Eupeodes corollae TaxID=290404 RepID=UPI00249352E0|nr:uncharacterized protein LOC129939837 isoform X1 [Eupeodes corollae]